MLNNPLDLEGVNSSGEQVDPFFVHFFAIRCEFPGPNQLPEDWRERFKEFEHMEVEEHKDFDRIQVKTDRWVYRLTGRSLEVKLRNEISGSDVSSLKDRAWNKAIEGVDHLEELVGESIPRDMFTLRIQTQHIGARRRDITKAFIDHIDQNTIADPRKFRVTGEDDEIRIYCDASGPGGMLESESGNGGQVNGRMDTVEDDRSLLQEVTRDMIEDPESSRRLLDSPNRIDRVESRVSQIEETMDQFSRVVANSMEELTNTVENNVGYGDQVQKQVMEMKTTQEDLQEELVQISDGIQKLVSVEERSQAVQSSRTQSDQEIVERLEEISEKIGQESSKDSIVNPLAEHVEVSNKWEDRWGNIRAYSPELEKQFKLIDSEDLP